MFWNRGQDKQPLVGIAAALGVPVLLVAIHLLAPVSVFEGSAPDLRLRNLRMSSSRTLGSTSSIAPQSTDIPTSTSARDELRDTPDTR